MQGIEYSLPTAEARERISFEAEPFFPGLAVPTPPGQERPATAREQFQPAEACTELGWESECIEPARSVLETGLVWSVGLGAAAALVSLAALVLPFS